jgi:hypothetical protein
MGAGREGGGSQESLPLPQRLLKIISKLDKGNLFKISTRNMLKYVYLFLCVETSNQNTVRRQSKGKFSLVLNKLSIKK